MDVGIVSDRLLTTRETADHLGRSRDFVMALVRSGRLVATKVGARYYVPEWSVQELTHPNGGGATGASEFPEVVVVRGRRVR